MSGLAALRAGAGLVTVASAAGAIPRHRLPRSRAHDRAACRKRRRNHAAGIALDSLAEGKTVVAMGPGLGRHPDIDALVSRAVAQLNQPLLLDADALAALSKPWPRPIAPGP